MMIEDTYNEQFAAGREALAGGSWKDAFDCFSKAVALQETAEGLEQLGMAAYWNNDVVVTFEAREGGYRLYLKRENYRGAARLACLIATDYVEFRGDVAIATGWLGRAQRLLENVAPCTELGYLRTLEGHVALMVEKDTIRARTLAGEAVRIGRMVGASDVEIIGLALEGLALVSEGEVVEGMRLLDESTAAAVAGETDDLNAIGSACCYLIAACDRVRDYDRAAQWCQRVAEFCRRWQYDSLFGSCRTQYASILISQGRWKEAESELQAAVQMLSRTRPGLTSACTVRMGELRRRQGRWEEAEQLFGELPSYPLSLLGRAALALDRCDAEGAVELSLRYLRRVPSSDRVDRVPGLDILIRACAGNGQFGEAEEAFTELREIVGRINTDPLHAVVSSTEGVLALARGETARAVGLLEDAVDRYERSAMPFEAGRFRFMLAQVMLDLGAATRAKEEVALALQVFIELEAAHDVERAQNLLGEFSRSSKRSVRDSDTLSFTRREEEILSLIATGMSNEEIADKLFLSVRTIERHVSNIYQKIGASGRAARVIAASYARRKVPISS